MKFGQVMWCCDLCGYDQNAQDRESCEVCGFVEQQDMPIKEYSDLLNIKDKETV
jgi:ribosomal protein L37E